MLDAIRLRNLRSFRDDADSPFIELKPLTVFVGKNSCGKSTCLRSLPLLRQSIEARTTGPILWFGSYVDFGAFSEAVTHNTESNIIYFDFNLEIDLRTTRFNVMFPNRNRYRDILESEKLAIGVKLGVTEVDNKTIAKSILITFDEFEYDFQFSENQQCSLKINGEVFHSLDSLECLQHGQLLPMIGKVIQRERTINGDRKLYSSWDEKYVEKVFTEKLRSELDKYFHSNTSEEKIDGGLQRLGVLNFFEMRGSLRKAFSTSKSFTKNLHNINDDSLKKIHAYSLHKNIVYLLTVIDDELSSTFKNIRYIAPLRATAERYYRHQDLQVDEIDHTGSNLAMLLKSWSSHEQKQFASWTMNHFGFKVRVNESGLHYALMVQTRGDDKEYNINDMGFGFSQILPIVASLWLETINRRLMRRRRSRQLIFAN